ncbi:extensin family protein [Henriciella sp.]|uniref:extensin-like domain-containing protein n=1 Tax=Henriciella sp. TaxID=1968823 RepID=UPI002614DE93|nr:extensin family protein [Henriciella sp.]
MKNTLPRLIKQLGVVAAVILAITIGNDYLPPQHNPLRPINLNDPIGVATGFKLARIKADTDLCYELLDKAQVGYTPLAPDAGTDRCPLERALVLEQTNYPYSVAPLRMSCHQTAALYIWEHDVITPLAEEILGSPVEEVLTYGTFSCRNIAGTNRLSEHGRANAIDIRGFRLEDGRIIDVRKHWRDDGQRGEFLTAARDGACKLFSVVLGPDYNAAHADHFHFDMGGGTICR